MLSGNFGLQDFYNVRTYGAKEGDSMLWNYKLTNAMFKYIASILCATNNKFS